MLIVSWRSQQLPVCSAGKALLNLPLRLTLPSLPGDGVVFPGFQSRVGRSAPRVLVRPRDRWRRLRGYSSAERSIPAIPNQRFLPFKSLLESGSV